MVPTVNPADDGQSQRYPWQPVIKQDRDSVANPKLCVNITIPRDRWTKVDSGTQVFEDKVYIAVKGPGRRNAYY